jgi:hypothetical protein
MMRIRALLATIVAAVAAVGCGQQSGGHRQLTLGGVPLVRGARVVAQARSCDRGAHAYCSLQLVVSGSGYRGPTDLLNAEEGRLRALGWTSTVGDTPKERSADSPGHRLRLSLGLAPDDLLSWDQTQIRRRPAIARALSRAMFERVPTLSLMLLTGSS